MAKYEIKHSCGHTRTMHLFGPIEDRERKVRWLSTQPCPDCRFAAEADDASKSAQDRGLKVLTGSPRQIDWAAIIREKACRCLDAISDIAPSDAAKQMVVRWREGLNEHTSAQWWIDNKYRLPDNAKYIRENIGYFTQLFK